MEEPGAIHHVFARGNNKSTIFVSEEDRFEYLRILEDETRVRRWNVLAYCLMGNHVHLLTETPEPNLAAGMRKVHCSYARSVHGRTERIGHMFNERYGSSRVFTDARLRALLAYLALNPVESRFCSEPGQWPWSSFGRLTRTRDNAPVSWQRLAELLATDVDDLLELHLRCIEAVRLVEGPPLRAAD